MKIKICGMREPENIHRIADLQPDYLGFIFYPFSKRYAGDINEEVLNSIPSGIKKTGVFVNAGFDEILPITKKYQLNAVQLHGDESPGLCLRLKGEGLEVIKAAGISEHFDFATLEPYLKMVDHFLFDTKTPDYGGSGKIFDWELLKLYPYKTSYLLSGGLREENLSQTKVIEDERLYAVDLNSKFETAPGIKDVEKVQRAINYIRS